MRHYSIIASGYMTPSQRESIYPVDRDHLITPETVIENFENDASTILKASFDVIWNASGWVNSKNYDENGKWNIQR